MAGPLFWKKRNVLGFDFKESREDFCQRGTGRYILKKKNSIQRRTQEDKEELEKTKKNSRRQRSKTQIVQAERAHCLQQLNALILRY